MAGQFFFFGPLQKTKSFPPIKVGWYDISLNAGERMNIREKPYGLERGISGLRQNWGERCTVPPFIKFYTRISGQNLGCDELTNHLVRRALFTAIFRSFTSMALILKSEQTLAINLLSISGVPRPKIRRKPSMSLSGWSAKSSDFIPKFFCKCHKVLLRALSPMKPSPLSRHSESLAAWFRPTSLNSCKVLLTAWSLLRLKF